MFDTTAEKSEGGSAARITACWQIFHIITSLHGSHPMGQVLIALTINVLHRGGYSPTAQEICRATGLPKANVSRYITWQLKQGYLKEAIDPIDRRLRRLEPTEKGRAAEQWLDRQLEEVWCEIGKIAEKVDKEGLKGDPKKHLERMTKHTEIQATAIDLAFVRPTNSANID